LSIDKLKFCHPAQALDFAI